jgi:hypothetical protein
MRRLFTIAATSVALAVTVSTALGASVLTCRCGPNCENGPECFNFFRPEEKLHAPRKKIMENKKPAPSCGAMFCSSN